MTLGQYITGKLAAFDIPEGQFIGMSFPAGLSEESDIADITAEGLWQLMADTLEELILAPRVTSVSESGFSRSWDFSNVARYYVWLCRKCGKKPSEEVLCSGGISSMTDFTDRW